MEIWVWEPFLITLLKGKRLTFEQKLIFFSSLFLISCGISPFVFVLIANAQSLPF